MSYCTKCGGGRVKPVCTCAGKKPAPPLNGCVTCGVGNAKFVCTCLPKGMPVMIEPVVASDFDHAVQVMEALGRLADEGATSSKLVLEYLRNRDVRDTRPVAIPAPVCRALVSIVDGLQRGIDADKREIQMLKAMVATAQNEANVRKMSPPFSTDGLNAKENF